MWVAVCYSIGANSVAFLVKEAGCTGWYLPATSCHQQCTKVQTSFSSLVPKSLDQPSSCDLKPCMPAAEYVRHPMYAGVLFCAFGLSAITASEARFVLSAVLFVILNRKVCSLMC